MCGNREVAGLEHDAGLEFRVRGYLFGVLASGLRFEGRGSGVGAVSGETAASPSGVGAVSKVSGVWCRGDHKVAGLEHHAGLCSSPATSWYPMHTLHLKPAPCT